jgi:hypothetical protein
MGLTGTVTMLWFFGFGPNVLLASLVMITGALITGRWQRIGAWMMGAGTVVTALFVLPNSFVALHNPPPLDRLGILVMVTVVCSFVLTLCCLCVGFVAIAKMIKLKQAKNQVRLI